MEQTKGPNSRVAPRAPTSASRLFGRKYPWLGAKYDFAISRSRPKKAAPAVGTRKKLSTSEVHTGPGRARTSGASDASETVADSVKRRKRAVVASKAAKKPLPHRRRHPGKNQSIRIDYSVVPPLPPGVCKCEETLDEKLNRKLRPFGCQAEDHVDDLIVGCSILLNPKTAVLARPSPGVPFLYLCPLHLQRLRAHECCPRCGYFCTQGQFAVCRRSSPAGPIHLFHIECGRKVRDEDLRDGLWQDDDEEFSDLEHDDGDGEIDEEEEIIHCPHCRVVGPALPIKVELEGDDQIVLQPEQGRVSPVEGAIEFTDTPLDDSEDTEVDELSDSDESDRSEYSEDFERSGNSEEYDDVDEEGGERDSVQDPESEDIYEGESEDEEPLIPFSEKPAHYDDWMSMREEILAACNGNFGKQLERSSDITRGKEALPVQCYNEVDDEPAPDDFVYTTENIVLPGVRSDTRVANLSCKCEGGCKPSVCPCMGVSFGAWYTEDGRLSDHFNTVKPHYVVECGPLCSCVAKPGGCPNRLVQHGIVFQLQLFRTEGRGWGVKTLENIPQGSFVCEYVGELISDIDAEMREEDSYLFDMDPHDPDTTCIDARSYGNIGRFINHRCDANLSIVRVLYDHQDVRYPHIAFFASQDIPKGSELGYDYGEKFWVIKGKTFKCTCGAVQCKYTADKIEETLAKYWNPA